MNKLVWGILILALLAITAGYLSYSGQLTMRKPTNAPDNEASRKIISLPSPKLAGEMSLEETILKRRSRRDFQDKSLTLAQISQLLWSGQGINDPEKKLRTVPSAGALYPLEIYLLVGENGVENLPAGLYHYLSNEHQIEKLTSDDLREKLKEACLGQEFIAKAPASIIIAAEFERTTQKYGERGIRYVWIEAGHAAQNICLQAQSLGLGTVTVGAFEEEKIIRDFNLPSSYQPVYVLPVGYSQ